MSDNIDERQARHRAAIRGGVIYAALDLNDHTWTPEDDLLLDTIDRWLDTKAHHARVLDNVRPQMPRAVASVDTLALGNDPTS